MRRKPSVPAHPAARRPALGQVLLALAVWLVALPSAQADEPGRLLVTEGTGGTLIFSRPRAAPERLEGLVVDSEQLIQELKARVLEARGLGEVAQLSSVGQTQRSAGPAAPHETPYVFADRFGAPFAGLEASLRLSPLAEPDDRSLSAPLALLLGGCVVLGLYALYRMTKTQIEFAEHRNNFVSAVSHELKTPLTAIRMYAEMLEGNLVPDETRRREYYRTISAESERLSRLINNVLELARIEKRPTVQLLLGDIAPVVAQALEVLRPHVEREGFTLELAIAHPLPSVRFEPDALRQILFNLVDNALKYSREASERRISVHLEPKLPDRVLLLVRDCGPGVHQEQLRAIFQPFFRAEPELTRKTQGTGIGLSLVQGLVERMGGGVHCANADPGFEIRVEFVAS